MADSVPLIRPSATFSPTGEKDGVLGPMLRIQCGLFHEYDAVEPGLAKRGVALELG